VGTYGPAGPPQLAASFIFLGHRAYTINRRVGDQLPACHMVLDVIGDLFTHGRQLKRVFFQDRIVRLPGKFPICGRLAP
jgi:hypothetical protein